MFVYVTLTSFFVFSFSLKLHDRGKNYQEVGQLNVQLADLTGIQIAGSVLAMVTSYVLLFVLTGHEPGTDLGPLISPQAKQRVLDLVQSGVEEGAELLLDGRNVVVKGYEKGNFVGPTILHKVQVLSQ